jgi:DNA polymerase-3 subunit alpha
MLYQEQVMQTLHSLAGYSLSDADIFRQIMSKKLRKMVEFERKKFISGATKKDILKEVAEKLFDRIAKFAGYGFNKSHATAYAFVAFRTAWLKAHYPAEFFAAMMNSHIGTPEKFPKYKSGCKIHNINILPPDLNKSHVNFSVELIPEKNNSAIRFGLAAIKNVGLAAAEAIISEREANGDYKSIDDFTRRINHKIVNKKTIESLVKAGAADCFNLPRQRMMLIVDDAASSWDRGGISEFQRSFFDAFDDNDTPDDKSRSNIDKVVEWDLLTRLSFEKEVLGIYVSGHPLDNYAATWRSIITNDSRSMGYPSDKDSENSFINSEAEKKHIMGGLVIKTDWRVSKKQKVYGIVTFEDIYGTYETLLWSDLVEKYRNLLKTGEIWFANGIIRTTFGKTTLSASNLFHVNDVEKQAEKLCMAVDKSEQYECKMEKLQDLVKKFPGSLPVELKIISKNKTSSKIKLPDSMLISPTENFLYGIEKIFGEDTVKVEI